MTQAINNPSWSISTEIGFYLIFPFILPLLTRLRTGTLVATALGAWLLLTLPAWLMGYGLDLGMVNDEVVYKNPAFRLGEFVVGVAAGLIYLRKPSAAGNAILSWVALALTLLVLTSGLSLGLPRIALVSGALAPMFALLIFAFAQAAGPATVFTWKPLVLLGEVSYAFYLAHYPVALSLNWLGITRGTNLHFTVTFVVTLLVAFAAYFLVERPARVWLRGLIRKTQVAAHSS